MRRGFGMSAAVAAVMALGACATPAPEGDLISDPFESLNRDIHNFNVGMDQVVLRPTTWVYRNATPTLFQFLVGNAVNQLKLPVIFLNHAVQGNVDGALTALGRFGVNTIVGAGGLLDPATEFGLPLETTDGGLTFARYGAEEGPYLVAPFLGPFTGRDFGGQLFDFIIDPTNFIRIPGGAPVAVARIAAPIVDIRSENFELIDDALYNSEDSYVTVRTGYVLSRRRAVADIRGEAQPATLPDIYSE